MSCHFVYPLTPARELQCLQGTQRPLSDTSVGIPEEGPGEVIRDLSLFLKRCCGSDPHDWVLMDGRRLKDGSRGSRTEMLRERRCSGSQYNVVTLDKFCQDELGFVAEEAGCGRVVDFIRQQRSDYFISIHRHDETSNRMLRDNLSQKWTPPSS